MSLIKPGAQPRKAAGAGTKKRDKTHYLYMAVLVGVVAGIVVGWLAPEVGKSMAVLGTTFLSLIKMIIAPIIFCTIVIGVGSVRKAASVGKIGGLAMLYFLLMSTVAMAIGLLVGNWIQPGTGLNVTASTARPRPTWPAPPTAAPGTSSRASSRPRWCPR